MNLNATLAEQAKPVLGLAPVVPSTSTPDYVSLKNYERCEIMVLVKNATTVTGSAITVKQATAVAGTSEKALTITKGLRNIDLAADDALASFDITSSTFTTDSTNSKNLLYVIDVKAEDLDTNNGFDCIRAGTGDATAATVTVMYRLYGPKYSTVPSAIID